MRVLPGHYTLLQAQLPVSCLGMHKSFIRKPHESLMCLAFLLSMSFVQPCTGRRLVDWWSNFMSVLQSCHNIRHVGDFLTLAQSGLTQFPIGLVVVTALFCIVARVNCFRNLQSLEIVGVLDVLAVSCT